jgi:hypothetical protein
MLAMQGGSKHIASFRDPAPDKRMHATTDFEVKKHFKLFELK